MRSCGQTPPLTTKAEGVSVVIPTLDRAASLLNCLEDLLDQNYDPMELVVVDQSGGSKEETRSFAREHEISYYDVSFRGLPRARNFGWQKAVYDAILFVDDDIRCGPELVAEHRRALETPDIGIVAGRISESQDHDPANLGRFNFWTGTPNRSFDLDKSTEVDHAGGSNFSTWKQILSDCGGFDERLAGGAAIYEETEFCLRAKNLGYRIQYQGSASVQHLAEMQGGCRVNEVSDYVHSLAHNRAVLIRRHLFRIAWPIALFRLLILIGSYARHYRSAASLEAGWNGLLKGFKVGACSPLCTKVEKIP